MSTRHHLEPVRRVLAEQKRTGAESEGVDVGSLGLRLVPATPVHLGDDRLIERLAGWRERHMSVYPTQFRVTVEGTRAWLRDRVLGADDRIMFLIVDGDDPGDALGHLGFDHAFREDGAIAISNVVRGERLPSGGIDASLGTLLDWGYGRLGVASVWCTPFADNFPAVRMLHRAGFADEGRIPLRRHELEGGRAEYRPVEPGDDAPPDRIHLLTRHRADARR